MLFAKRNVFEDKNILMEIIKRVERGGCPLFVIFTVSVKDYFIVTYTLGKTNRQPNFKKS
jgi:hypothetical protein